MRQAYLGVVAILAIYILVLSGAGSQNLTGMASARSLQPRGLIEFKDGAYVGDVDVRTRQYLQNYGITVYRSRLIIDGQKSIRIPFPQLSWKSQITANLIEMGEVIIYPEDEPSYEAFVDARSSYVAKRRTQMQLTPEQQALVTARIEQQRADASYAAWSEGGENSQESQGTPNSSNSSTSQESDTLTTYAGWYNSSDSSSSDTAQENLENIAPPALLDSVGTSEVPPEPESSGNSTTGDSTPPPPAIPGFQ